MDNSFRQFIKDGLVGVVVALIVLVPFSLLVLDFLEALIVPMELVLIVAFIGSGIGGRYFENVSSRKDWIRPAFLITLISGVITCALGYILLLVVWGDGWLNMDDLFLWQYLLFSGGFVAGIGFISSCLIGVIFNPITRVRKILIGAIGSTITGFGMALTVVTLSVLS